MDTCDMQAFYTRLIFSGGLNWIPHLSVLWSEMETGGRHVPSFMRSVYNYTRGHQFTTRSTSRRGCHYKASC
ncbi:hypothetical protein Gotur_006500 [Gossypium turneri]